jgi:phosphate transport system substrate-binding protein
MKYPFVIVMVLVLLLACSGPGADVAIIRIKGSDSMLRLNELLAEAFMERHSNVSVYIEGGGTAAGVKALAEGFINICAASRPLRAEEIKEISDKFGSLGISYIVAKDAISIFVNSENPVRNFSQSDLKKIFSGEISNWNSFGWDDAEINVIIRNPNSGTQLYFKEHILGRSKYAADVLVKSTTEGIVTEVSADRYSISFGSFGYHEDVMLAMVDSVEISDQSILNDSYPISRYLMFYTLSTPRGAEKEFIDWCLSQEAQSIIETAGYVPLYDIAF